VVPFAPLLLASSALCPFGLFFAFIDLVHSFRSGVSAFFRARKGVYPQAEQRALKGVGVRAAKSFSARGRAATPHPGVSVKRRNAICQAPFHGGKLKFWFPDWHSMPACRRRAVPLQRNLNVNFCGERRAAGRGHEVDPQNLRLVDLSASCGDSVCRLKTKKPPRNPEAE
jgi:hypothetical protein